MIACQRGWQGLLVALLLAVAGVRGADGADSTSPAHHDFDGPDPDNAALA